MSTDGYVLVENNKLKRYNEVYKQPRVERVLSDVPLEGFDSVSHQDLHTQAFFCGGFSKKVCIPGYIASFIPNCFQGSQVEELVISGNTSLDVHDVVKLDDIEDKYRCILGDIPLRKVTFEARPKYIDPKTKATKQELIDFGILYGYDTLEEIVCLSPFSYEDKGYSFPSVTSMVCPKEMKDILSLPRGDSKREKFKKMFRRLRLENVTALEDYSFADLPVENVDNFIQELPENLNGLCKAIMKENFSEVVRLGGFRNKNFLENVNILTSYNFSEEDQINLFNKHLALISCSFREYYEKLLYLSKQVVIDSKLFKKIYLEGTEVDINSFDDVMRYLVNFAVENGRFPYLFNSICNNDKLILRDRLVNASIIISLDLTDVDSLDLFAILDEDNIVFFKNMDDKNLRSKFNDNYFNLFNIPCLDGIKVSIIEHFNIVMPGILDKIASDTALYDKFKMFCEEVYSSNGISSINTLDERGRVLKNTIVGKFLLVLLANMYTTNKGLFQNGVDDFTKQYKLYISGVADPDNVVNVMKDADLETILDLALKPITYFVPYIGVDKLINFPSIIKDEYYTNRDYGYCSSYFDIPNSTKVVTIDDCHIIEYLLKIDPYSFDMFRNHKDKNSPHIYECVFATSAKNNGYYFLPEDAKILLKYVPNFSVMHDGDYRSKYVADNIFYSTIPIELKSKCLDLLADKLDECIKNKNVDETVVFQLYRALGAFLFTDFIYLYQDEESRQLSLDIFSNEDGKYTNMDRLLYCGYYFNKLAHGVYDNSSKFETRKRLYGENDNNKISQYNSGLSQLISGYTRLAEYGVKFDDIYNLIGTNGFLLFSKKDGSKCSKLLFLERAFPNIDFKKDGIYKEFVKGLSPFSRIIPDRALGVRGQEIVDNIKGRRLVLDNLEMKQLREMCLECQQFFAIKNKIQELVIRMYLDQMNASLTPEEFYEKNGYYIEVQGDLGRFDTEEKEEFIARHGYSRDVNDPNFIFNKISPYFDYLDFTFVVYDSKFDEPFSLHIKNLPKNLDMEIRSKELFRYPTIAHCRLGENMLTRRENKHIDFSLIGLPTAHFISDDNALVRAATSNFIRFDLPILRKRNTRRLLQLLAQNISLTRDELLHIIYGEFYDQLVDNDNNIELFVGKNVFDKFNNNLGNNVGGPTL